MKNVLRCDPYVGMTAQTRDHIDKTVRFFEQIGIHDARVLDVGQRSPLTDALQAMVAKKRAAAHRIPIENTSGDLDHYLDFYIPSERYDVIIYSHTIEHQFCPLHTLLRLKLVMAKNSRLYIITPDRGKLLWCKGHYHEIDSYRMGLLLDRAGLKIISKTRQKVWRGWRGYPFGIRPLLRLLIEYNAIYTVTLK